MPLNPTYTKFDNINDTTLSKSVNDWHTIFATQTDGTAQGVAQRIMADMWGYGTRTKDNRWHKQDAVSLANALIAAQQFSFND